TSRGGRISRTAPRPSRSSGCRADPARVPVAWNAAAVAAWRCTRPPNDSSLGRDSRLRGLAARQAATNPANLPALGLVLVLRAGRPVRVHHQRPAPAVDGDLVVEGAQEYAVLDGRLAAVGLVLGVVHLARRRGLVAPAGPLAVPVPQHHRVA